MRFTILLPTRNRADKLAKALRSALDQDFDDYEVLVSDNCSTDDTAAIIGREAHPRLRSIQPGSALPMSQHWEFALRHVRGERVLVLCDDDALTPDCLATLASVARNHGDPDVIQYDTYTYVYADGVRAGEGNAIRLPERLPEFVIPVDMKTRLRIACRRMDGDLPKLLNCCVRRVVLDDLRSRFGSVFGIWSPDYSVGLRLLSRAGSMVRTGALAIWGENMRSYGSGARNKRAILEEFMREYPAWKGRLTHSPYPELLTVTNVVYDTIETTRRELGALAADMAVEPIRFRKRLIRDLEIYERNGDTSAHADLLRVRRDLGLLYLAIGVSPPQWFRYLRYRRLRKRERESHRSARGKPALIRHEFADIHQAARFTATLRPRQVG